MISESLILGYLNLLMTRISCTNDRALRATWPLKSSKIRVTTRSRIFLPSGSFSIYCNKLNRLTGCTPFFGDNTEEIVDKNTMAIICFDFKEIGVTVSAEGK